VHWHVVSLPPSRESPTPCLALANRRDCSLAYCEMYVTLGTLFRRFERLQVWETSKEDLVFEEYFTPHHPVGARVLHVTTQPDN
jgi:hypothetical protein